MVNLVESYLNISILTQILDILRVGKNAIGVLLIEKNVRKFQYGVLSCNIFLISFRLVDIISSVWHDNGFCIKMKLIQNRIRRMISFFILLIAIENIQT